MHFISCVTSTIATLENPHQKRKSIKNSEFQLFGLVLSVAISVGSCWTPYSPKFQYTQYALERSEESHQCRILASTPFFRTTPKDVDGLKEQLIFLTEFSRFMNSKSLSLLWVTCIPIQHGLDIEFNIFHPQPFSIRNLPGQRKSSMGARRCQCPCLELCR